MKIQLSEKMITYLWLEAEKKALTGFDSLFTFCRATKHGFIGNKEKTKATISLNGLEKTFYFQQNN
jgi:hypothetical protein